MRPQRGLQASAYALVHAAAATPLDRERHAAFLTHMLLLAFVALAVAPLFLAFRGAPTPAQSLLFALSLSPAGAAMAVSRTGRLVLGQLVAFAGVAGVALVLFFGVRTGPGAAIAWLVAAYVEALASHEHRLGRLAALVVGSALAGIVALSADPRFAPNVSPGSAALVASFALLAGALASRRLTACRAEVSGNGADGELRAVGAMIDAVIVDLDASGSVRSFLKPEESLLLGIDHTILGRGLLDRVLVADRPAFLKLVDDAAHGARSVCGTFRMRADIDERRASAPSYSLVELRARRIAPASASGTHEADGIVAVLTDVGARDRREHDLAEARRAVEEALRAKDQFLATMSHELRTPLNSIIGFSDILASRTTRPDDVARQCEFARVINQSGQHLLAIVNTVLDLSRIQSGALPMQPEPFAPTALLDHAADALAANTRETSLRLVRDYPEALEEMVGDKRLLSRALVALLSNAVKFTPARGRVTLTARPEGNSLVVTVADTGVGIAAENLARIGEPFFQASGSISRPFDGAGLGLALARGLVGLHGGTLAIESAVGVGTRATMRLPLDCRTVAADPAAAIATSVLPHARQRLATPIKDAA